MPAKSDRGFDHLVLCVRDLDVACDFYRRLGFTLTPRAVHPFGTGNSLVQLRGAYLELLTVIDATRIPAAGTFSFAGFNRDFLARREGVSMLALQTDDAHAERVAFERNGLTTYPTLDFSRGATLPDGQNVTVSFSLTFIAEPRSREASFFLCQHHTPQFFWDAAYQAHANGALGVKQVAMVAPDPRALMGFFARLSGSDAVVMREGQLVVAAGNSEIVVVDHAAARTRFPGITLSDQPQFAAYRVAIADPAAMQQRLRFESIPYREIVSGLQIGPGVAGGVFIEFAAA